tara:strand:+ start:7108 stop:9714 length:2607 start_codon:yes stop_codon:yes gene_type:complete
MKNIEPTYLRYVYDNLNKGSLNAENAAALPQGFIGLYEQQFTQKAPAGERKKVLNQLALWALFKGPVSANMAAAVLELEEEQMKDLVDTYSSWFNSPESGKYQLYHERIKVYLLSKVSRLEIQLLSKKILQFFEIHPSASVHFDYKLRFYIDHLIVHSYESDTFRDTLDNIVHQNDFWEVSFSVLKSIQPAIENIRNLISFAVFKQDWKLLYRCSQIVLFLEQKNDILCEQILKSKRVNFEQIDFCFSSISSPFTRLRFLSLATTKDLLNNSFNKNSNFDKYIVLWEQLIKYVESEYIDGAIFLPYWLVNKLNKIVDSFQIEALSNVLEELDFDELEPIEEKEFEFIYLNDELEDFSERDLQAFYNLNVALENLKDEFITIFKLIDTPNLMDRDELLTRSTLICIEKNYQKSFDWLYWLLVKSDFEIGEHAPPDEKYYTKNLVGKYIQLSDIKHLKKIEQLVSDADLYNTIKMELRTWISDKYYQLKEYQMAFEVLNMFNNPIESTFDISAWKGAWFTENNKSIDLNELRPSFRLDTLLAYPEKIATLSFNVVEELLTDLDSDKISKAEYFAETAIKVYSTRLDLAKKLTNSAWESVAKTSDWASIYAKVEILCCALSFMKEDWISKKLRVFEAEYLEAQQEDEFIEEALQNFYNYNPFRFNDKNTLQLALNSSSIKSFLNEVDEHGLENAIENEKIEKLIINKAKKAQNFRSFWSEVKSYFTSDGVGCYLENFWSFFKDNKYIFQNVTAEDVRIIGVISRKVDQHFPTELHVHKSLKLQLYEDRIPVPDDWEYGSKKGFEAMLSEKTLEKETVCNAILSSPRNGNELTQTSINAVGYMLLEVLSKKELVQDVSAFLTLRKEIFSQYG